MNSERLEHAVAQLRLARTYTNDLLDHIVEGDWFRSAGDEVSHVGWQVGHLVVCEYALVMKRIRGERPADADLLPPAYIELFGKGSTPAMDATAYPTPQELRRVLNEVRTAALAELQELDPASIDEPSIGPPHRVFTTKFGAIEWAAQHEFLHAGQIGLLRRQLGNVWLR